MDITKKLMITDNEDKKLTPIKAIKMKCLDCCCGQREEVKACPAKDCPLWAFRLGKNPNRKKRVMTDEQKKAVAERFAKFRSSSSALAKDK